jgi:hypothetical protein
MNVLGSLKRDWTELSERNSSNHFEIAVLHLRRQRARRWNEMARVVVKHGRGHPKSQILEYLLGRTSVDYSQLQPGARLWGVKEREGSGFVSSVAYGIALRQWHFDHHEGKCFG